MIDKQAPRVLTAIGLMSGTSMDGVDVAMIRSDGRRIVERGAFMGMTFDPAFRQRLADALDQAKAINLRTDRPGDLARVEDELTQWHVNAVQAFAARFEIDLKQVDVIGFHGQTVLHRPHMGVTVQLGNGALLARKLNVPVVYDMRAGDMEAGGEGAPLAPAYHGALSAALQTGKSAGEPIAFVNIGGISNITCVDPDGTLTAFDTGPGNSLIDQWVEAKAGIPFDQGGAIASEGRILRPLVDSYLAEPFFVDPNRRSLDRNDFLPPASNSASLDDGARSLARLTAEAIVKSAEILPKLPRQWIICGGGRNNRVIMDDLAELVGAGGGVVLSAEEVQLDGDAMEAEAWAYLAIRSLSGLPLSWPGTTGCKTPVTGGVHVDETGQVVSS